jgi:hypothetical protein
MGLGNILMVDPPQRPLPPPPHGLVDDVLFMYRQGKKNNFFECWNSISFHNLLNMELLYFIIILCWQISGGKFIGTSFIRFVVRYEQFFFFCWLVGIGCVTL